jgi:hypothetical protein
VARKRNGNLIIELASIAWIIPIFVVLCVNAGVIVFAGWVNDSACRDAARAASLQSNPTDALAASKLAIVQFKTASSMMASPTIVLGGDYFEYKTFTDSNGKPDLSKGPYVRVSTRLRVKVPCSIMFNGAGFTNTINMNQSYTYPIMNPNQSDTGTPFITAPTGDDAVIENGADPGTDPGAGDNQDPGGDDTK